MSDYERFGYVKGDVVNVQEKSFATKKGGKYITYDVTVKTVDTFNGAKERFTIINFSKDILTDPLSIKDKRVYIIFDPTSKQYTSKTGYTGWINSLDGRKIAILGGFAKQLEVTPQEDEADEDGDIPF